MTTLRSNESYQTQIYEFLNDIYVVCPSCQKRALVKSPVFTFGKKEEKEIRLICTHCGHSKRLDECTDSILLPSLHNPIKGKYLIIGAQVDPYFHLPLWLMAPCCNETLWAYNYRHIDFLKLHVGAKLRERNGLDLSNKSLGSRLPKWICSQKNRTTILKALDLLAST